MADGEPTWQKRYLHRLYNSRPGWISGTDEFHELCRSVIPPNGRILEIGAGPSNKTSRFLATLGELHGADPDSAVHDNDALVSAVIISDSRLPVPDEHFDACVANYVLEHIADAEGHLREVARVLKPGGVYVFRTPNRFHYVSLIAASTPHWFLDLVANRARNLAHDAHEPYPTVYALNSRAAVRKHARNAGLEVELMRMVEKEPSYAMFSRAAFLFFTAYERVVNATEVLAPMRANIFGLLRKPRA
jgi:SAM-dependent methyltransferase